MFEDAGGQFLHKQNPELHKSEPVQHEQERLKRSGVEISQKPAKEITDWLTLLERTHLSHRNDPEVIARIKEYYHREYIIKPEDIPDSYFEAQRRLAREQGYGEIEITQEMRQQAAEIIRADQQATLDLWLDYFLSPLSDSFPMWAKYWAFKGMTKLSVYDKEKHMFAKRDKSTVAPFPDLNREALAYVLDAVIKKANQEHLPLKEDNPEFKKLLKEANFGKLYAWALEKVGPTKGQELLETKGEWRKYPQGSDPTPLVESLQGWSTGWCTAGESTAQHQLQQGDFYVYYSYDQNGQPTVPRIAIRMDGCNRIGEIRGIAHEQNLDHIIAQTDILSKKLEEFGEEGKKYQKKSQDMKYLTEIEKKHQQGLELTKEDLRFLYEIDSPIEGFGWQADPRIEEIRQQRHIKSDLAFVLGCKEEEISLTKEEALAGGIIYHYGDLDLSDLTSAQGLILPKSIRGNLDLRNLTSAQGLTFPESIGGYLDLSSLTSAQDLTLPESIGGGLYLRNLTSAQGLTLPKSIGGNLDLRNLTSAQGLTLPESIEGSLYLSSLTSAQGFTFPKSIEGDLDLNSLTSAQDLTLPESIGGSLYLRNLTSAQDLTLPESIGGSLDLSSLTSAQGLTLPESIEGNLYLNSLTSAQGLTLPKSIEGDLDLINLTSAQGLTLPESIGGSLYLNSLTSAQDLTLPESIGGFIYIKNLDSLSVEFLQKTYPQLATKIYYY